MGKPTIFWFVLWCILLIMTIVLLAVGVSPEDLIGEFLGLASPLICFLVRKRK